MTCTRCSSRWGRVGGALPPRSSIFAPSQKAQDVAEPPTRSRGCPGSVARPLRTPVVPRVPQAQTRPEGGSWAAAVSPAHASRRSLNEGAAVRMGRKCGPGARARAGFGGPAVTRTWSSAVAPGSARSPSFLRRTELSAGGNPASAPAAARGSPRRQVACELVRAAGRTSRFFMENYFYLTEPPTSHSRSHRRVWHTRGRKRTKRVCRFKEND